MTTRDEFIRRATKVTAFNLSLSDFTSDTHKDTIRYLYETYFFSSMKQFNYIDSLVNTSSAIRTYNACVEKLKNDDRNQFKQLHFSAVQGIGPSELVMYLLTSGVLMGGSQTKDIQIAGRYYEIKSAKWYQKRAGNRSQLYDFKLGSNITGLQNVISDLQNVAYTLGLTTAQHPSSIPASTMQQIKSKSPDDYNRVTESFGDLAAKYLNAGKSGVIFIQNEANQPDFGHILGIKSNFTPKDIMIERYTSGTIKPIVTIT